MAATARVVVTGMGIASPIGNSVSDVVASLRAGKSGIVAVPEWQSHPDLASHIGGLVTGIDVHESVPRKHRRTMGRVAELATYAANQAVADAGLTPELLTSGRVGLAVGSTTGSTAATLDYYANILGPGMRANKSTAFLQVMSHTCAANLALVFGITGRVWGPNSACTSGSQAIGLAFDTLRLGAQDVMLCGGAEEAHFTTAGTFDLSGAASRNFNAAPDRTPRPFDRDRDGMVVGEGAGILVLERYDSALARGAHVYAEILGFATTCDGEHITSPAARGMERCIRIALEAADLTATDIGYINAHATGTEAGDLTEAQATAQVFGDHVPVSSTKSFTGHTLGACGGIESIFSLLALRDGFVPGNRNLDNLDPRCQGPWFPVQTLERHMDAVLNNNFAFGGINTSLVFARI